jgi:hypothetical protein
MQDHALVIKADARAMSAITALSTRVSDRWQGSKPSERKFDGKLFTGTSECISYKADGTASIFRSTRTRKTNRVTPTVEVSRRITAADLMPIGDQNH